MTEFEKIFAENREFIYRYLLKLCRSASLAEELTQETFFRAYINFASISNKARCSSWLCSTAKNCYYAWYNSQKRLAPLEEESASLPDPGELAAEKELSERAAALLDALEEPYGAVFRLAVLGGVSLKDISLMYGKSESWARVTYYRARQKLAERMDIDEL